MRQVSQAHRHHPIPNRVRLAVRPAMRQKFMGGLQVFAGAVEAPTGFGIAAFLYFNGHQAKTGGFYHQVYLGTVAAAIETALGGVRRSIVWFRRARFPVSCVCRHDASEHPEPRAGRD